MLEEKNDKFSTGSAVDLSSPSSPLESFAKKVLDKLIEENTPPIPYYYQVYFFNLLDEEPSEFKKQIFELIDIEETNEAEKDIDFEKKLKLSFKYSKDLLQKTALLYKLSDKLTAIMKKYKEESSHIANPKAFEKLTKSMEDKLTILIKRFNQEMQEIKTLYAKNVETLKAIESNSIFDSQYGIFNKIYFLKELKKEIILIEKFSHTSSIVLIKIEDSILNKIKSEKSKLLANRSVAKIILKTSRRTDVIAHYENGIFAMLLKHTDRIGASKTIERLADTISMSAVFLEGEEIELRLVGSVVEIKEKKDETEYMAMALNTLKEAEQEHMLYKVYEG